MKEAAVFMIKRTHPGDLVMDNAGSPVRMRLCPACYHLTPSCLSRCSTCFFSHCELAFRMVEVSLGIAMFGAASSSLCFWAIARLACISACKDTNSGTEPEHVPIRANHAPEKFGMPLPTQPGPALRPALDPTLSQQSVRAAAHHMSLSSLLAAMLALQMMATALRRWGGVCFLS